ncbi:MAG: SMC-Scp complex subunit ScpB [Porticoccaceae bacterium]|jgi:segregation and condensation protein B|nr:SMC-Scp complex subunit ScpB [Porticoccaceae bacterium]MDG1308619.1 SMC-Scp complex subunit ScpB [Porticoccaceae bacterium]
MNSDLIKKIIEGALLAAGKPMDIARLESLFEDEERPPRDQIKAALEEIEGDCRGRGFQLKHIASGYRLQVNQELAPWVNRLWDEKPKRYSRAMLETLSLIAYRQPLTRGDIELVRGVAVSSDIIKTLQERDWVRVVGHRDVPGRPALYATTKQFLDYFNLRSLEHLPALSEIKDFAELDPELELALGVDANTEALATSVAANDEVVANENDVLDDNQSFALDRQTDGTEPADSELEVQPSGAQDYE